MNAPQFELRQLHYFLVLAGELHFSRSAQKLFISQSALSQQISRLEETLGVRLFERDKHRVELTRAGRVFVEGSRATLVAAQQAAEKMRHFASTSTSGRLRIGFLEYAFSNVVLPAFAEVMRRYPGAKLEQVDLPVGQLVPALMAHQIDLGVGLLPFVHEAIESEPVFSGQWVALLPREHPLAAGEAIAVEALVKERLVLFQRSLNPVLYDGLLTALHRLEVPLQVVYETAQVQTGPALVKEGIGIFLVASYAAPPSDASVVRKPIEGLGMELHIGACWRKGEQTPLMGAFLAALRRGTAK